MSTKTTENKPIQYEKLSVEERYKRIEAFWQLITTSIEGKNVMDIESFFITLHKLGDELNRFVRHYFNDPEPSHIIGNCDILNKVNKIQLMIKIK